MKKKTVELEERLEMMEEEVKDLRRHVAGLTSRLDRLEVREELIEEPSAAGDEPVPR